MGKEVLCFMETQLQHLLNGNQEYLENFKIFFNSSDNKCLSLAYAFQKNNFNYCTAKADGIIEIKQSTIDNILW